MIRNGFFTRMLLRPATVDGRAFQLGGAEARRTLPALLARAVEVHEAHLRSGGKVEAIALAHLHEGLDLARLARLQRERYLARDEIHEPHVALRLRGYAGRQQ